jgi:transcriptional regulator with XRE-family HTH domain
MDLKAIGAKIKYLRQTQDLTQKELGEKIGTSWEMISRYETGKSSPLARIDRIAESLNTTIAKILTDNIISEEIESYSPNFIPFIDKKFTDINLALKETKKYYTAPNWIIQKYLQPFCIDTNILKLQTTQITKSGVLFAVQEKPLSKKDVVIVLNAKKLLTATTRQNSKTNQKMLATVIAWEKRFR